MSTENVNRRDFLKIGAMAGVAAVAAMHTTPAFASTTPRPLSACMEMSPVAMAEASAPVSAAWQNIRQNAEMIRNPGIRKSVVAILDNPAPTLTKGMSGADKKAIYKELSAKGLIKDVAEKDFLPPFKDSTQAPQPFYSAPGSGYGSHHAYPGGLATHTDLNVRSSLAIHDNYCNVYNYLLDRDVVLAAQLLHDLHKPWVFQWGKDGESRAELKLAGTGEHHPLSVAESIVRGLPAEVIVAQACAHNHPRTPADEAQVVGWLQAGAIIAGVDPIKRGLLVSDGKTLPLPRRQEGFVTHLGDHDWVLTVPAVQWVVPVLEKTAVRDYGISQGDLKKKPFHQFRNYVFSQVSAMSLYETYAAKGEEELIRTVRSVVTPA
ncbi:twin-arginine translocation signal domain-containing protein [Pseudodesulfovibrio sp.]|uniref:twin-arginine translocation signal domain-containing protein n=1 Tax=unclassified Pseudodesulfovibrio TaxID=2661612 RepID=UPI003B00F795